MGKPTNQEGFGLGSMQSFRNRNTELRSRGLASMFERGFGGAGSCALHTILLSRRPGGMLSVSFLKDHAAGRSRSQQVTAVASTRHHNMHVSVQRPQQTSQGTRAGSTHGLRGGGGRLQAARGAEFPPAPSSTGIQVEATYGLAFDSLSSYLMSSIGPHNPLSLRLHTRVVSLSACAQELSYPLPFHVSSCAHTTTTKRSLFEIGLGTVLLLHLPFARLRAFSGL